MSGILLLGVDGRSTRIVFHALNEVFNLTAAVIEPPVSRRKLLTRRAQKIGFRRVAGQIAFSLTLRPWLKRETESRVQDIIRDHRLCEAPIDPERRYDVPSVNGDPCRVLLQSFNPRIVVINGTRIIGADTLSSIQAPFINMHAGLTPRYRGVHGAYWACLEGEPKDAGVTIHRVDLGIDTGAVLAQSRIPLSPEDNFESYPYLQLAHGLPLLIEAVKNALSGDIRSRPPLTQSSQLWSHPTLFQYISGRLLRNVR